MQDLYEILGITKDATPQEIKKAYNKEAFKFHPDRNALPEAHEEFLKVKSAYDVLKNHDKRKKYDETGQVNTKDINTIISDVIRNFITHIVNSDLPIPDSENIIESMKKSTENEIEGLKREQVQLEKKKLNAEKIKKRITRKSPGDNLFTKSLDMNIAEFEKRINLAKEGIMQRQEFIKHLADYTYEPIK